MNARTELSEIRSRPLGQVGSVGDLLINENARVALGRVAASHMNPERMMRVVANAIRTTPTLKEAEPMSFLGALMTCASLGLEPNTVLGHAYLVPFKNNKKKITEVQVIVGYKGLIDLARRSGHITSISAGIHYADDDLWDYEEGTESRLRHRPGPRRGEKLHAYAVAKFKDGGYAFSVLPWPDVMRRRDGSQGYQSAVRFGKRDQHPWVAHEDPMAMKTAIRDLSKFLPLSIEFMQAVAIDEAAVDYASFAAHPEDDIPAGDGEGGGYIEGQVVGDGSDEQSKPAQAAEKPQEKPAQTKAIDTKPTPNAKAPEGNQREAGGGAGAEPAGEPAEVNPHEEAYQRILGTAMDAGSMDRALEEHGEEIDAMQKAAPALYKRLMGELEQFAPYKDAAASGQSSMEV